MDQDTVELPPTSVIDTNSKPGLLEGRGEGEGMDSDWIHDKATNEQAADEEHDKDEAWEEFQKKWKAERGGNKEKAQAACKEKVRSN